MANIVIVMTPDISNFKSQLSCTHVFIYEDRQTSDLPEWHVYLPFPYWSMTMRNVSSNYVYQKVTRNHIEL